MQSKQLMLEGKHEEAAQLAAQREDARQRHAQALRKVKGLQRELVSLEATAIGHQEVLEAFDLELQQYDDLVRHMTLVDHSKVGKDA